MFHCRAAGRVTCKRDKTPCHSAGDEVIPAWLPSDWSSSSERIEPRCDFDRFRERSREEAHREHPEERLTGDGQGATSLLPLRLPLGFISVPLLVARSLSPFALLLSLLPPLSRCPILQEQVLIATKYSGEWPTYGAASLDSGVGAEHEMTKTTTATATATAMMIEEDGYRQPRQFVSIGFKSPRPRGSWKVTARDKGRRWNKSAYTEFVDHVGMPRWAHSRNKGRFPPGNT